MPHSVRSLIHKCFYQGKITQAEHDKIIRKLDSLERKGWWILHPRSRIFECSECHRFQVKWSNYCPDCGAKME